MTNKLMRIGDSRMRVFVGNTDINWFNYLANIRPDEVNFWQPASKQAFRALDVGEMFLFRLKSPINHIAGGGFFLRHVFLPISLAWEAFGEKNGAADYYSFSNSIYKYRKTDQRSEPNPEIGCIILSLPFFFDEKDWIPIAWKPGIVQGKTYDMNTLEGKRLIEQVQGRLGGLERLTGLNEVEHFREEKNRYGKGYIVQPRIGQGAFKVLVTEAYHRRCAISGERTLPVLDAAHIKPYSLKGPHSTSNGLLLRKDLHTLFDKGFITIDEKYNIEVSKKIKECYGNGRDYYAFHGKKLEIIPDQPQDRPSPDYLRWHNENIYLG